MRSNSNPQAGGDVSEMEDSGSSASRSASKKEPDNAHTPSFAPAVDLAQVMSQYGQSGVHVAPFSCTYTGLPHDGSM